MTVTAHVRAAEEALFERAGQGIGLGERRFVGAFAAALTAPGSAPSRDRIARLDAADRALVEQLVESAAQRGPWGTYREPGLRHEDDPGDPWQVPDDLRVGLGDPLVAVLEHVHLLLLHPRDARPDALARLLDAGWGRAQVVTWSQLVSFVAFETRLRVGLAVLEEEK